MRQYKYTICGIVFITFIGMLLIFLESTNTNSKNFVSFNDGSIDCITIRIPANPTKEKLAQALIQGHDIILGKAGNTPGCVNYEFN